MPGTYQVKEAQRQLPALLRRAERVRLLVMNGEADDPAAGETVRRHLARHGVEAEFEGQGV